MRTLFLVLLMVLIWHGNCTRDDIDMDDDTLEEDPVTTFEVIDPGAMTDPESPMKGTMERMPRLGLFPPPDNPCCCRRERLCLANNCMFVCLRHGCCPKTAKDEIPIHSNSNRESDETTEPEIGLRRRRRCCCMTKRRCTRLRVCTRGTRCFRRRICRGGRCFRRRVCRKSCWRSRHRLCTRRCVGRRSRRCCFISIRNSLPSPKSTSSSTSSSSSTTSRDQQRHLIVKKEAMATMRRADDIDVGTSEEDMKMEMPKPSVELPCCCKQKRVCLGSSCFNACIQRGCCTQNDTAENADGSTENETLSDDAQQMALAGNATFSDNAQQMDAMAAGNATQETSEMGGSGSVGLFPLLALDLTCCCETKRACTKEGRCFSVCAKAGCCPTNDVFIRLRGANTKGHRTSNAPTDVTSTTDAPPNPLIEWRRGGRCCCRRRRCRRRRSCSRWRCRRIRRCHCRCPSLVNSRCRCCKTVRRCTRRCRTRRSCRTRCRGRSPRCCIRHATDAHQDSQDDDTSISEMEEIVPKSTTNLQTFEAMLNGAWNHALGNLEGDNRDKF